MLTSSLMYNIAVSDCDGCENERVIVLCRFIVCVTVTDAIPRILLHVDVSLFDVTVFRQKVFSQHQGKVFRRFDAELFCQQINGIFLRIGCNNVRVITCEWDEINKSVVKRFRAMKVMQQLLESIRWRCEVRYSMFLFFMLTTGLEIGEHIALQAKSIQRIYQMRGAECT